MNYYRKFQEVFEQLKEEEHLAAILLVGKTAKAKEGAFDHLNDIDLLVVFDNNREFQRQVENIDVVPFDISYISIFDLITQVEERSEIWVNMIMGAKVYFSKNELIFGIIDRVKDIYLNGTGNLPEEEIKFIRFNLSNKLNDVMNRQSDVIVSSYLMQRLFDMTMTDYYAIKAIWQPSAKNLFDHLKVIDETLCNLSKEFIYECTAKGKLLVLEKIIDYVLEPIGGRLNTWEKGHYHISR
jgi:predicted nucleotidyltransferase